MGERLGRARRERLALLPERWVRRCHGAWMLDGMGTVDFDDDTIRRYVIRRYQYSPERRQRRHVVVGVVDSRKEYKRLFEQAVDQLQRRRDAGEEVDPQEHISGCTMEAGHLARARNGHLIRRAVEHGVLPDRLQELELPGNMALMRSQRRSGVLRAL